MTATATLPRNRTTLELHRNHTSPLLARPSATPTPVPEPEPGVTQPVTEPDTANPAPVAAGTGLSDDFETRRAEALRTIAASTLYVYGDSARTATQAARQRANL